ncbi:MAG: hypothetical protein ACOYMA_20730 [Bacteroidia bacterium]
MTTIIGATLGFIFALLIYWIGEEKKKSNEKYLEKVNAYNSLKRFSLLLASVYKTCQEQNTEFNLFSKELTRKPLGETLPKIFATNDRKRLVEADNMELFHSFMLFDKENKCKFNDYKNIFNHADFIHNFYSDLITQNEKHLNFIHSDLKVVETNSLNIIVRLETILKIIQLDIPDRFSTDREFIFLEKYRQIYAKLKGSGFTDLELFKDDFFLPLQNEIFSNITNKKIAAEIILESASAITKLNTVRLNSIHHAAQYANIDVKESLEYIDKIRTKIDEIDEP